MLLLRRNIFRCDINKGGAVVDHSGVSPLLPAVLAGASSPSCGALRTALERPSLTEPLSPRRGGGTP